MSDVFTVFKQPVSEPREEFLGVTSSLFPIDTPLGTSLWAVIDPQFNWTEVIRRTRDPKVKDGAARELFTIFDNRTVAAAWAQTQNKSLLILEISPSAEVIPQLPLVRDIEL